MASLSLSLSSPWCSFLPPTHALARHSARLDVALARHGTQTSAQINLAFSSKFTFQHAYSNMSKLQLIREAGASTGQTPRSSATSVSSTTSASPRTKRKYKETLSFVTFHSKVNMRRKWRSKSSAFAKFIDLESDFDSSELNVYTVR